MKGLSEMPQKLVLFFLPKLREKRPNFLGRERERPALPYYPPSPFSLTCPPISLLSLSACGSRAPPCWVPPLLLSPHRRRHPAHHGGEERAHGGGGRAAGRGRQREPRQAPPPLSLGPLSLCWKPSPDASPNGRRRPSRRSACPMLLPPPRAPTLAHSHRSWGDWAQTKA